MIRWRKVEVEKRAGRETMAGSLCEMLRVWRAWAPWEQKGGQCSCSRDRERDMRDWGQGARFENNGTLWFTGTSVFFTVPRNVPVLSVHEAWTAARVCEHQHSLSPHCCPRCAHPPDRN